MTVENSEVYWQIAKRNWEAAVLAALAGGLVYIVGKRGGPIPVLPPAQAAWYAAAAAYQIPLGPVPQNPNIAY